MLSRDEMVQKIKAVVEPALRRIGAENIQKKVDLALKFAMHQPPAPIMLDGKTVVAVAVDIATVFSLEGCYHQIVDDEGAVKTAEAVQALSVVLADGDVRLCKSIYDAIGMDVFLNARYWTTALDALTEEYIC